MSDEPKTDISTIHHIAPERDSFKGQRVITA